ncbi:MAG: energy-coupling factor transport system ATP-binding protein [Acidimicrobiaceae bacterium]|nr:energy-coupling factor transport system ATP-binding protein [Acidimicrobiaceae bacterium]
MIDFTDVTITYNDATRPALRDVSLHIPEGELCLVVGRTGVGKSTLLGAMNGLVPHFTGGTLSGTVTVAGLDTRTNRPRELADVVGMVMQDPLTGFVTDTVEEELAYGMEQLAIPAPVMRKRVEETLDLLGLADLRRRSLRSLSGGQQQRVAIGSVLTAHPRILVLDEPTSALDPAAAEDVLSALIRLVHDLGITVVLAEHRLERVVEYADVVVTVSGDGTVAVGDPQHQMARSDVAPPVVRLGRLMAWDPLPLSVRDARRRAEELRACLRRVVPDPTPTPAVATKPLLVARGVVVRYDRVIAVAGVDINLHAGEVVALMGRNGSGKSSLLWALQGSGTRHDGKVVVHPDDADPAALSSREARRRIALVPQSPGDLLYLTSVRDECTAADHESGRPSGACRDLLDRIMPGIDDASHPRDLSEGQRLALAIAVQLCAEPPVILLDEPTRGLDELAKERFAEVLGDVARRGAAVVVATHDVEFVARVAHRVVVLADGEIVADGPTAAVVVSSPVFAPQVAKVLDPLPFLTVHQIERALARVRPS